MLRVVGEYRSAGEHESEVALDDIDGSIFEMLRQFGIRAPEHFKIEANYTAPRI